jgi:hypothetical protein
MPDRLSLIKNFERELSFHGFFMAIRPCLNRELETGIPARRFGLAKSQKTPLDQT